MIKALKQGTVEPFQWGGLNASMPDNLKDEPCNGCGNAHVHWVWSWPYLLDLGKEVCKPLLGLVEVLQAYAYCQSGSIIRE